MALENQSRKAFQKPLKLSFEICYWPHYDLTVRLDLKE